jgi:hypothetical protein
VVPCNVVVGYESFRGPCCHHLQGEVAGSQNHFITDGWSVRLGFELPFETHGHIVAFKRKLWCYVSWGAFRDGWKCLSQSLSVSFYPHVFIF